MSINKEDEEKIDKVLAQEELAINLGPLHTLIKAAKVDRFVPVIGWILLTVVLVYHTMKSVSNLSTYQNELQETFGRYNTDLSEQTKELKDSINGVRSDIAALKFDFNRQLDLIERAQDTRLREEMGRRTAEHLRLEQLIMYQRGQLKKMRIDFERLGIPIKYGGSYEEGTRQDRS